MVFLVYWLRSAHSNTSATRFCHEVSIQAWSTICFQHDALLQTSLQFALKEIYNLTFILILRFHLVRQLYTVWLSTCYSYRNFGIKILTFSAKATFRLWRKRREREKKKKVTNLGETHTTNKGRLYDSYKDRGNALMYIFFSKPVQCQTLKIYQMLFSPVS